MRLELIRAIPGLQIHYANDAQCLASSGFTIIESSNQGESWRKVSQIPISFLRSMLSRFYTYTRCFRDGIRNMLPVVKEPSMAWLISAANQLYLIDSNSMIHQTIHTIKRGSPMRHGITSTGREILIAEYWGNSLRESVNITRIDLMSMQSRIFYQFAARSIRHVHVVQYDHYSNLIWVGTGDEDQECMVIALDPITGQCKKVIGRGSQNWRTASFAFQPHAVFWGTDNPRGANYIWKYNRKERKVCAIGDVIGPVYYSKCLEGYVVIGTTVEKNEGEQDGLGRLYVVDQKDNVKEVWKQSKDNWNPRLFGYGIFEFASGDLSGNRFWVTAKGFTGGLCSYLFSVENA
jgi:hypothetical protein